MIHIFWIICVRSRNTSRLPFLNHCHYTSNIQAMHVPVHEYELSHPMRKPTICIGENKDADQLRGNREADQHLCFRYSDSAIPLLLKSEISSFYLFSALVQAGLCRTCSETTLLVFPRGGSIVFQVNMDIVFPPEKISLCIVCECKQIISESWNI